MLPATGTGTTPQTKLSLLISRFLRLSHIQSLGKLSLKTTSTTKVTAEPRGKASGVFLGVRGGSLTVLQPQERLLAPEHKGAVVHPSFSLRRPKEREFVCWSLAPSADKPPPTRPSPPSARGTHTTFRLEGPCPANVTHLSFPR